jgi:hypothetical protein
MTWPTFKMADEALGALYESVSSWDDADVHDMSAALVAALAVAPTVQGWVLCDLTGRIEKTGTCHECNERSDDCGPCTASHHTLIIGQGFTT